MATYIATGAGTTAYNGTYTESGTFNGSPAYTNGTRWLYKDIGWILGPAKNYDINYYYNVGAITDAYLVGIYASAPAPTVTLGGGTPSGPANVKTFQNVAKASVKTSQGVAIASVKSSQGIV